MAEVITYVFPLEETVFYPKTTIPLNIFEPRYIQMINDSLNSNTPIALCAFDPTDSSKDLEKSLGGRSITAGSGHPNVVQRREDGGMTILLTGTSKVRILEVLQKKPYIVCKAELVQENLDPSEENRFKLNRLSKIFANWIEDKIEDSSQKEQVRANVKTPAQIVEYLAMLLIQDFDIQQLILETDDINDRIQTLSMLLQSDGTILSPNPGELN